jgi:hypothetical protein
MSESNVLDILQLLLSKKESLESLESLDKNIYDAAVTLIKQLENYESIDKEMVARLNDMFSNDLIKKREYADIIKAITEGSTVVYFKSAQLFKVYKKSELETLNTHRNGDFGDCDSMFQLILNKSSQKVIMIADISLLENVDQLIQYVVQFMHKTNINDFCADNITYSMGEELIININGYYVKNIDEKDKFVKSLMEFIYMCEKNDNMVRQFKLIQYCEFEDAKVYYIPLNENIVGADNYRSLTDVSGCKHIFAPKTLPIQQITNHNNVYIYTDHDYNTKLRSNRVKDSKWVYFICDGTNIKIGKTKNMKKRISQLQTGNAQKLVIVSYIESDTMDQLETQFHKVLIKQHVIGEWYNLDRKKAVEMLQRCRHGRLSYY